MAKSKSAKEILEKAMPEMEVVETTATAADAAPVARPAARPGPSLSDLRKKYLGDDAAPESDAAEDADGDVEVVQVRPKGSSSDPAASAPKTVIVSKKKNGVVGFQG